MKILSKSGRLLPAGCALASVLTFAACDKKPSPEKTASQPAPKPSDAAVSAPVPPSLEDEARALVRQEVNKTWVKQGNSYFCVVQGDLTEAKGLWVQIDSRDNLTSADKLNGLEWRGIFRTMATACRSKPDGSTMWEQWSDGLAIGRTFYRPFLCAVEKRDGKWALQMGLDRGGERNFARPSPDQLPGGEAVSPPVAISPPVAENPPAAVAQRPNANYSAEDHLDMLQASRLSPPAVSSGPDLEGWIKTSFGSDPLNEAPPMERVWYVCKRTGGAMISCKSGFYWRVPRGQQAIMDIEYTDPDTRTKMTAHVYISGGKRSVKAQDGAIRELEPGVFDSYLNTATAIGFSPTNGDGPVTAEVGFPP